MALPSGALDASTHTRAHAHAHAHVDAHTHTHTRAHAHAHTVCENPVMHSDSENRFPMRPMLGGKIESAKARRSPTRELLGYVFRRGEQQTLEFLQMVH